MKYIISEQQYNSIIYKRRHNQIKKLIDGLSDNPDLYDDEDEFYDDVKDLVYKNVFIGNREDLHWDKINRKDLMLYIDDHFRDYIRNIYRKNV